MKRILLAFLTLLVLSSTGYLEKFGIAKHSQHNSNNNYQQTNYNQVSSNAAHY